MDDRMLNMPIAITAALEAESPKTDHKETFSMRLAWGTSCRSVRSTTDH
jgi:hypothetical protein